MLRLGHLNFGVSVNEIAGRACDVCELEAEMCLLQF
jgi:hypothetical protein